MNKNTKIVVAILAMLLFMAACSNDNNSEQASESTNDENNHGDDNNYDHLYHDIGKTFEVKGIASNGDAEATVHEIWTEPGDDHQSFIEEHLISPEGDENVTFAEFTVKNNSEKTMYLHEITPEYKYPSGKIQLDVSYPEDDRFEKQSEATNYQVEPGDELDLVGAVVTEEDDKHTGALIWNVRQDIPEVVFHKPQSERKDKLGSYEVGEPLYPIDHGDDGYLEVTVQDTSIVDDAEGLNPYFDNSSFIVLETEFENTLDDKVEVLDGIPEVYLDGDGVNHGTNFSLDGKWIDVHKSLDGDIEPGETVQGDIYLEVKNDEIDDVDLLFLDPALLAFPDYAMKLEFN